MASLVTSSEYNSASQDAPKYRKAASVDDRDVIGRRKAGVDDVIETGTPEPNSAVRPHHKHIESSASPSNDCPCFGEEILDHHREEAEKWLSDEINKSKLSYLNSGPSYSPLECTKKDETIPVDHLEKAFKEYKRRYRKLSVAVSDRTPLVVLVATGLSPKWTPGENTGSARFLLFPELGATGNTTSALFITYMPGSKHGAVDSWFVRKLSTWHDRHQILDQYLSSGGLSSGGYGHFQPDKRIFPFKDNRDHGGRDIDRANENNPYSRFIWEVEYDNRDPTQIRERGKAYLTPHYTRLFFAVKLYVPVNGTYKAAAVLWGKGDGDNDETVTVKKAVSFGTADLSDEDKNEFFQRRADRLVGVCVSQWERPQDDAESWLIPLPYLHFLFKVSKGKPTAGEGAEYVLDDVGDEDIQDLVIDLRGLAREYENQIE